uniref:Uncharacterized protein n=1 Tax=Streptomyces sp. NBC_00180 TaxID=2903632 RepID=A0AAU1I6Y2_9ACTN
MRRLARTADLGFIPAVAGDDLPRSPGLALTLAFCVPESSTSRSASPVPVTGPDQVLVTMVVTGGYAGVHKEVTLRGDGSVHTDDKGERAVRRTGAAEFTELRTLLGDPALDEVSDFTKDTEGADMFQYTLRFDGRTVMTDRSVAEPALDRLVDALSEWLPER